MDSDWSGDSLRLLGIMGLVLMNGLFVAAEFSLVSVRKTQIEELVKRGRRGAKAAEYALFRLDRSIAAVQLGVTIASIALGWLGEPFFARLIEPLFSFMSVTWAPFTAHTVATTLALLLVTFIHVTLGELVPKSIAIQEANRLSLFLAPTLNLFARLTRPLTWLMSGLANTVVRSLGYKTVRDEEMVHSIEELLLLIEDTEEAGVLDPEEADLVENVFRLSEKTVADCLVPRDRMAALELNTPPDRILEAVRRGAHTRMPVYEKELDNIVGIVNTKDLFFVFSLKGVVILEDAIYPALYLKPEASMATALRLFRQARRPMALVRDEHGKIHGLITLEDVLEEIVGDIEDEHDRPTPRTMLRRRLLKRRLPAIPQLKQAAVPRPAP